MLWYDLLFTLILCLYMFWGYLVGFLKPVAGLAGLLIATFAATRYYIQGSLFVIQVHLEIPHDMAKILGFILVWIAVFIIYSIIATIIINSLTGIEGVADWNRWLGLALNFSKGIFIITLIFWLSDSFTPKVWTAAKNEMHERSFLYKAVKPIIPVTGETVMKLTRMNWSQPLTIPPELQKKIDERKKLLNLNEAVQKKINEMINHGTNN